MAVDAEDIDDERPRFLLFTLTLQSSREYYHKTILAGPGL